MEKLSKNFLWMAAANVASSLFSIILGIYMARVLLPNGFGCMSYAFTLAFFLYNFVDLGLSTYGVRAVASNRSDAALYASRIITLRLFISSLLVLVLSIACSVFIKDAVLRLITLESLLMLFSFALATEWVFQGLEKMHMVFISFFVTGLLQLALLYALVKGPEDLGKAPVIYFVATLPVIIAFLIRLRVRLDLKMSEVITSSSYLKGALVLWAICMFAQVYNGLDIFIIGLFRGVGEVGQFTVARRVAGGVIMLLMFLANALLPHLSRNFAASQMKEFKNAVNKFVMLGFILLALVFLPTVIFGKIIVNFVLGAEYMPAVIPLNLMIVGVGIVLFNLPYSTALIAAHFEKDVLKQTIASAASNLLFNFILIPSYGMIGASISFIIAEVVALVWILWAYSKNLGSVYNRTGG